MFPEAPKSQVEEWLRTIGSTPVETADVQSAWHLEFDYPARTPHRMVVANPVALPMATVIVTGVQLMPQHIQNFTNLDDDEKEGFLWDLRQKAISPDADFQFVGVANPLDCPTQIQFSATRYADGLTLDSFAKSLGAVFKAELGVIWLVQQRLGGGEVGPGKRFDFKRLGY